MKSASYYFYLALSMKCSLYLDLWKVVVLLLSLLLLRAILFFSPFSVVRPTQIFGIFQKKKRNDVVKPFFTWNNSFNLKNKHSSSIEKNCNKNRSILYSILCILLVQIHKSFNVILGYQGLLYRDFLWFIFFRFFFSVRSTDPISGNAFDDKRTKKKDGLVLKKYFHM